MIAGVLEKEKNTFPYVRCIAVEPSMPCCNVDTSASGATEFGGEVSSSGLVRVTDFYARHRTRAVLVEVSRIAIQLQEHQYSYPRNTFLRRKRGKPFSIR